MWKAQLIVEIVCRKLELGEKPHRGRVDRCHKQITGIKDRDDAITAFLNDACERFRDD